VFYVTYHIANVTKHSQIECAWGETGQEKKWTQRWGDTKDRFLLEKRKKNKERRKVCVWYENERRSVIGKENGVEKHKCFPSSPNDGDCCLCILVEKNTKSP